MAFNLDIPISSTRKRHLIQSEEQPCFDSLESVLIKWASIKCECLGNMVNHLKMCSYSVTPSTNKTKAVLCQSRVNFVPLTIDQVPQKVFRQVNCTDSRWARFGDIKDSEAYKKKTAGCHSNYSCIPVVNIQSGLTGYFDVRELSGDIEAVLCAVGNYADLDVYYKSLTLWSTPKPWKYNEMTGNLLLPILPAVKRIVVPVLVKDEESDISLLMKRCSISTAQERILTSEGNVSCDFQNIIKLLAPEQINALTVSAGWKLEERDNFLLSCFAVYRRQRCFIYKVHIGSSKYFRFCAPTPRC